MHHFHRSTKSNTNRHTNLFPEHPIDKMSAEIIAGLYFGHKSVGVKTSDSIKRTSGVCKFRSIMIGSFWVRIFGDLVGHSSFRRGCPIRKVDKGIVLWGQASFSSGRFPCSGGGGAITLVANRWGRLNQREVVSESVFDFLSARPGWLWVSFTNHSPI